MHSCKCWLWQVHALTAENEELRDGKLRGKSQAQADDMEASKKELQDKVRVHLPASLYPPTSPRFDAFRISFPFLTSVLS